MFSDMSPVLREGRARRGQNASEQTGLAGAVSDVLGRFLPPLTVSSTTAATPAEIVAPELILKVSRKLQTNQCSSASFEPPFRFVWGIPRTIHWMTLGYIKYTKVVFECSLSPRPAWRTN